MKTNVNVKKIINRALYTPLQMLIIRALDTSKVHGHDIFPLIHFIPLVFRGYRKRLVEWNGLRCQSYLSQSYFTTVASNEKKNKYFSNIFCRPQLYLKRDSGTKVFSCEFCKVFKNSFFYKHLRPQSCNGLN